MHMLLVKTCILNCEMRLLSGLLIKRLLFALMLLLRCLSLWAVKTQKKVNDLCFKRSSSLSRQILRRMFIRSFPVESLTATQNPQRSPPSRTPPYPSPSWYNRHPPQANERRRSRNAEARIYIFAKGETEAPKTADDRAERGDCEGWIGRSGGGGESSCGEGSQCMV